MSAEKSFVLIVDKEQKNEVFRKMGIFCLNHNEYSDFKLENFTNDSDIYISLDREPALEYYTDKYEYTMSISNKYTFGRIHIWIQEKPNYLSIELWPLTNSLFDVLNKSKQLRKSFIDVIKSTDGYEFYIDNGDGSFEIIFFNRRKDSEE